MNSDYEKQRVDKKSNLGRFGGKFKNKKPSNESLEELKAESQRLDNADKRQNIGLRGEFAERIYSFASLYMFAVFLILFLSGNTSRFTMSDDVLMMLLGTTTANVLGLLFIVVNYLFPKK